MVRLTVGESEKTDSSVVQEEGENAGALRICLNLTGILTGTRGRHTIRTLRPLNEASPFGSNSIGLSHSLRKLSRPHVTSYKFSDDNASEIKGDCNQKVFKV